MNHPPPRPDPVFDPDLPDEVLTLLRATPEALVPAHRPTPEAPRTTWRFPLAAWVREHPVAAAVSAVVVVLVSVRLAARLFVFLLPLLVAAALVALVVTARRDVEPPAHAAARHHHGRYVTPEDLDAEAKTLLARAQQAVASVTSAQVVRAGHIDAVDNAVLLPHQLWEVATSLRRISDLRSRTEPDEHPAVAELLAERRRVLATAQDSVAARVTALEDYARRVTEADRAHADATALRRLVAEQEELRDLLAATAADDHAVQQITELTQRATAAEEQLRRAARQAHEAAQRLPDTG